MKKYLLIMLGLLILLTLIGGVYYFSTRKPTPSTTQNGTTLPQSQGQNQGGTQGNYALSITATDGNKLSVHNFLSTATEDADNKGYYSLTPVSELNTYEIQYIAETQYFNIALLKEPLGENRRLMEAKLMQLLGISAEDMCKLGYSVSIPNTVNSLYSGTNLGFSFCPDAVKLP